MDGRYTQTVVESRFCEGPSTTTRSVRIRASAFHDERRVRRARVYIYTSIRFLILRVRHHDDDDDDAGDDDDDDARIVGPVAGSRGLARAGDDACAGGVRDDDDDDTERDDDEKYDDGVVTRGDARGGARGEARWRRRQGVEVRECARRACAWSREARVSCLA